ncbi:MAG: glycosyltransferase [Thermoproteus sp.]|nr:glycosyltransferase [Thermoproteus sp.]
MVPTYNESENLPVLVEKLASAFAGRPYEVVVVDDSSPDGTAEVAERLAERYPVRVVLRRVRHMRLSGAVAEGARRAAGDVVVVMDADLQHPPEVAPQLAEAVLKGADLAVATRYAGGGGAAGWPLARRIISRGAVLLARALVPEARRISDPMSGFFAVRRNCLAALRPTGYYKILLDVLAQCRPQRVVEVPYVFRPRRAGESKLGVGVIADYLLQLMRISRLPKFAAVGASGIGVAEAVLYALSATPHWLSVAAAIEISLTWNYLWNRRWTFRFKGPLARGWAKYHIATAAGNAANYAVTNGLALAGIPLYAAYLLGVAAGFAANYAVAESYVFRAGLEVEKLRYSPQ